MKKLRKFLKTPALQEVLAITDVWAPRFVLFALLLLIGGVATQTPTEAQYLQAGLAAQGQQEYWRAEMFFEQAALIAPDDYQPSLDLARLHLLERQDDLAQSELLTANTLEANNADIWLAMGDVSRDQGNLVAAERAWLQATHFTPTSAQMQAHERLGLLYTQQGRWQTAEAQLTFLPTSDTLAQYYLGALRLERGDRSGASQAFTATINQTQDDTQRSAAQRFLQAIIQWNGGARSNDQVGYAYIQSDLPALAAAPLKQAISLAPRDASAHAYLGWVYQSLGADTLAQQEEHLALSLAPGNAFAYYTLSQLDLANVNYTNAITDLGLALISEPQNPVFWAALGNIDEALNDPASAERSFQQAAENAGGDPQYSLLLARFYARYQLGLEHDVALGAAQRAIVLNPTNGAAYEALGRIQQGMKDIPDAMNAFLQAVNFAPTNAVFHAELGNIQAEQGYLSSAELNLQKAIVLDLNSSTARQAQQILQKLPVLGG
jgi:tetratricopeptide (TPR) repeat protein